MNARMSSAVMSAALAFLVLPLLASRVSAQQPAGGVAGGNGNQVVPGQAQGQPGQAIGAQPFPALSEADEARLTQLLAAWEKQSGDTKYLSCEFSRWHFDNNAPAKIATDFARGEIKYAAPDKGLFRVNDLVFYKGADATGKPQFQAVQGMFGEYWVCNGTEIIEFDRKDKRCTITTLPPEMRGQKIFQSPLPFVFNLNAAELRQRFWIRELPPEKGQKDVFILEAHPKQQADRAQYSLIKIVIGRDGFLPQSLIVFAPHYSAANPDRQHYEFTNVKRNGTLDNIRGFLDTFIKATPGSDWEVTRESFSGGPTVQAQVPAEETRR